MQGIKIKAGWIVAFFAVYLLGIQWFNNTKTHNDIDSIFLKLDRLNTNIDEHSVQSSEFGDQITELSQQLTNLKISLASSALSVQIEKEPQEVLLQRDRLQQQNLNLQNEILRLRSSLDEVEWLEAQRLEQFQQPGSVESVSAQIIELQSDLAQINALEKLNDLDDDALDIFLNELAIEIAFQQDSGTDVENRQAMLEALSNTRERIASRMAAEQLEIIDTYIGSERFRTFVLAPGSNGSAGTESLLR